MLLFKQLKIHAAKMIDACGSSPKVLEADYRKTVQANREAA